MDADAQSILAKAAELAGDIKNSASYVNYRSALERLKSDPEAVAKVAFFKKENIKYRTKLFQNNETSFDEEKYISSLYAELMLIKACREFLDAENSLLELLSGALELISSNARLEFEIFE